MDALSPIGGLDWVTPGMKIAVKVNMMMRVKPDKAATVYLAGCVCAVRVARGKGASVIVGDSPGGAVQPRLPSAVYSGTGMRQVLDAGATLNEDFSILSTFPFPRQSRQKSSKSRELSGRGRRDHRPLQDEDPRFMAYTGACKNLFRAVPGLRKSEYHYRYNTHEAFGKYAGLSLPMVQAAPFDCGRGHDDGGQWAFRRNAARARANLGELQPACARPCRRAPYGHRSDVPTLDAAVKRGLVPSDQAN